MSRQIGDPVNLGRYELYPELKVRQRAVSRGLPGLAIFGLYAAFTLFNDWRYAHHIAGERVRRVEEEQEYRHNVLPFFQAEEDRRYLRARRALIEAEEKYAKDIPGWVVGGSVYNTRWMPPEHSVVGRW